MGYKEARELLVKYLNTWEPEGETADVLAKALQAFNECLDHGLTGEGG